MCVCVCVFVVDVITDPTHLTHRCLPSTRHPTTRTSYTFHPSHTSHTSHHTSHTQPHTHLLLRYIEMMSSLESGTDEQRTRFLFSVSVTVDLF